MKTIAVILLLLPLCISAQQSKSGKTNWRTITSAGFVAGHSGVAPVFDLSGGITYSRYFTGLGFGFDAYNFDAFPVFADWRMGIGRTRLLYVYATPGYVIPERHKNEGEPTRTDKMQGGFFYGCRFWISHPDKYDAPAIL